ncbi:Histone-lysine N-methyltransferase ASHH3 [Citrus sinensis]|uniref:Histone-lysine N-methyltransferase ASHH3 n=1 Tax=Citrus sinensis TaxID=2711 RepID=A0ACB8M9I9_CITSI|nr:Histone-lysine N-methyltransferase ASHH3 [Citrus sinensis]
MPAAKKNSDNSQIGHAFNKLLKQIGNPVEFELPDWFIKPKAIPYVFIKRNIYLTKRIKRRLEDDGIFCSCTASPGSSGVCDRDCHCGMLLSSCSSGCKCGNSCLNKPFQNRPVKKMKLVQTEKCGAGIVADEDIKRGEFVIEYVGEDQDCHCGAAGCRRKLGAKPSKPKISSDAALKLVACQVAVSSPKLKAILSGKDVLFEDGESEFIDMAKVDWELVTD